MLTVDITKINGWRAEQLSRFDKLPFPSGRLNTRASLTFRLSNLLLAAACVGFLIVLIVIRLALSADLPRIGQVILGVLFLAITLALFRFMGNFLRDAFGRSSPRDKLWQAGSRLATGTDDQQLQALRCYAEAMTLPWKKAFFQRVQLPYSLWLKWHGMRRLASEFDQALGDLLFAEMMLEVTLNTPEANSGVTGVDFKTYQPLMRRCATDEGRLADLLLHVRSMDNSTSPEKVHPIFSKLVTVLTNAPRTLQALTQTGLPSEPFQPKKTAQESTKAAIQAEKTRQEIDDALADPRAFLGEGNPVSLRPKIQSLIESSAHPETRFLAESFWFVATDEETRKAVTTALEEKTKTSFRMLRNVSVVLFVCAIVQGLLVAPNFIHAIATNSISAYLDEPTGGESLAMRGVKLLTFLGFWGSTAVSAVFHRIIVKDRGTLQSFPEQPLGSVSWRTQFLPTAIAVVALLASVIAGVVFGSN